jgi:hypothetical protein
MRSLESCITMALVMGMGWGMGYSTSPSALDFECLLDFWDWVGLV